MHNVESELKTRPPFIDPEEVVSGNFAQTNIVENNFERLSKLAISKARRMGVPEDSLDDVAQESLLAVWKKTQQGAEFSNEGKLVSYLTFTARSKSIDFMRTEKPTVELGEFMFAKDSGPEEQVIVRDELLRTLEDIGRLTPTRQEAVLSTILGEEKKNASTRQALSRARKELRDMQAA